MAVPLQHRHHSDSASGRLFFLEIKTYLQLKLALARLCGDIAKRVAAVDIQVRS